MNKEERDRKRRLRRDYADYHRDGESYPTYLERHLVDYRTQTNELNRMLHDRDGRIHCFWQYIEDVEKGMRIVKKSVCTLPFTTRESESVYAAVSWLQKLVSDARWRFRHGVEDDQSPI